MQMLELERKHLPYTKTEFRRKLIDGPLSNRSDGSIEFRMQNISAYRENKNLDWIEGYKPAKNIGINVERRLDKLFKRYELVDANSPLEKSLLNENENVITQQSRLHKNNYIDPIIGRTNKFSGEAGTHRGPPPRTEGYFVPKTNPSITRSAVYIGRYGDTNIYKFGYSQDIPNRFEKLNENIPTVGEIPDHPQWKPIYASEVFTREEGYAFESEIGEYVEEYKIIPNTERFQCSPSVIEKIVEQFHLIKYEILYRRL